MAAPAPNNDPRVFCTMGHGSEEIRTAITPTYFVPLGCTFVTLELAGMSSVDLPKILYAFCDPILKEALKYPGDPEIHRVLTEYFDVRDNSFINVRKEGSRFTNTFISLWAPAGGYYFKSGIYELGKIPCKGVGMPMSPEEKTLHETNISLGGAGIHPMNVAEETRNFLYEGSLFTPKTIFQTLEYRYLDFMNDPSLGPGVYYHFACRTPRNMSNYKPNFVYEPYIQNAQLRQAHALTQANYNKSQADLAGIAIHRDQSHALTLMRQNSAVAASDQGYVLPAEHALVAKGSYELRVEFETWLKNMTGNSARIEDWKRRINDALRRIQWSGLSAASASASSSSIGQPPKGRTRFVVPDDNDEEELTSSSALSSSESIVSSASQHSVLGKESFEQMVSRIGEEESKRQKAEQKRLKERSWLQWASNKARLRPGGSRTKRKTYRKKANRRTRKRSTHNI